MDGWRCRFPIPTIPIAILRCAAMWSSAPTPVPTSTSMRWRRNTSGRTSTRIAGRARCGSSTRSRRSAPLRSEQAAQVLEGPRSLAGPDLQLVPRVVDDQHVERAEHVHADAERRCIDHLPALEQVHVTEDDMGVLDLDLAEVDIRYAKAIARLHIERDAYHVLALGVRRRMAHERIAQRIVADRSLSAGVNNSLGAHRAHVHVRNQQPVDVGKRNDDETGPRRFAV